MNMVKCIEFRLIFILFILESSYTIYILTKDFQSDMSKPSIFIDLITDETISTNYMRMNTDSTIRENLENNVLGKFNTRGTRIEQVRDFKILYKSYCYYFLDQYNSSSYSYVKINFNNIIYSSNSRFTRSNYTLVTSIYSHNNR
jgi:hypothetical protein